MSEYYLALEDPREFRKSLLGAAKTSVTLLKSQYALKDIREKKAACLSELSEALEEIALMMARLEKELPAHEAAKMPSVAQRVQAKHEATPKVVVSALKASPPKKTPKSVPTPQPPKPKPKKLTKQERAARALSALEGKLSAIESKLNKL